MSEQITGANETPARPMAIREGETFLIDGRKHFLLPEGSNRPYQVMVSRMLSGTIPVAPIRTARIAGESGFENFFSTFVDVTDDTLPSRPMATVQAELVLLSEVFACSDRGFYAREGMRYPTRKPEVQGHNMDWIVLDPTKDEVRAIHYDFEQFFRFTKFMEDMWLSPDGPANKDVIIKHWQTELEWYSRKFGNVAFLQPLHELVENLQRRLTPDFVATCLRDLHTLHSLPKAETLQAALQGKLKLFKYALEDFMTDPKRIL